MDAFAMYVVGSSTILPDASFVLPVFIASSKDQCLLAFSADPLDTTLP